MTVSNLPRLGIAGQDDDNDIVMGIVLMRRGAESMPTIKRVEALIDQINRSSILPPGVHIERFYDRSDLINVTTHTVLHNMMEGMLLIFVAAVGVPGQSAQRDHRLGDHPVRAGLRHRPAAAARRIRQPAVGRRDRLRPGGRCHRHHGGKHRPTIVAAAVATLPALDLAFMPAQAACGLRGKFAVIANAATEVNRSIFFSAAIIIAGLRAAVHHERHRGSHLRPDGQDLRLCHRRRPDRHLHRHAGAVRPVPARSRKARRTRCWFARRTGCTSRWCASPWPTASSPWACWSCCWSSPSSPSATLGLEFLPKLEEGNLWIRATMPTSRVARGQRRAGQPDAQDHEELSRGRHRHLPARAAGRRHRRDRLLQRRVLRAAEAVRHLAGRRRQGKTGRGDDANA